MIHHFLIVFLFSTTIWASSYITPLQDFSPEKVKFTFMSTDGSVWINCAHKRTNVPHGWEVTCNDKKFSLHLFMQEYFREDESTYEFHYWVDEVASLHETHTHNRPGSQSIARLKQNRL